MKIGVFKNKNNNNYNIKNFNIKDFSFVKELNDISTPSFDELINDNTIEDGTLITVVNNDNLMMNGVFYKDNSEWVEIPIDILRKSIED